MVLCSWVHTNAGLCGPLVSVGFVGTSYTCWDENDYDYCDGFQGTNLGNACSSRLDDQLEYLACLASPATCTSLCASIPLPGTCRGMF